MSGQFIDEVTRAVVEDAAAPAIVMIATGAQPAALAIRPPAALGRLIVAGEHRHEVADERMSREHAAVVWEREAWRIRDLDSRNGTFVDGERISGEVRRRGDVILRIGHTVFVLLADGRGHPAPEGEHVVGPELARTYDQIRGHAGGGTLLLDGEPGTGKELAARLFHDAGPRRAGPFVAVRCATIPPGVAERLLFGAKKSAFAGAIEALGHFQMARGGTLFLDEIAELAPVVQAKLLRVVEVGEVIPVGATAGTRLDLGIVAASQRELRVAVSERRFRDDLYDRLARATVHLPPLRLRKVDLARLVQREVKATDPALAPHPKLLETCCLRPWPGNIRELRAAVRRAAAAAVAAGRGVVRSDDLGRTDGCLAGSTSETAVELPTAAPAALDRATLTAALARANGVVSVAARNLGLHRTQLDRLMIEHGIARDDG